MVGAEEMCWKDSFKQVMVEGRVLIRHNNQKILKLCDVGRPTRNRQLRSNPHCNHVFPPIPANSTPIC